MRGALLSGIAGFVVALAVTVWAADAVSHYRPPFARQKGPPGCWQLTRAATISIPGVPPEGRGAFIPKGSEYYWNGEVARFVVYLPPNVLERCEGMEVEPAAGLPNYAK